VIDEKRMAYEEKGMRPRSRSKKTWQEVSETDLKSLDLDTLMLQIISLLVVCYH